MMTLLAWLAPWVLGTGTCIAASGRPRGHGAWCARLGVGWLVGVLLTGWLLDVLQPLVAPQDSVARLAPWLLVAGLALAAAGWRWQRPDSRPAPTPPVRFGWLLTSLLLVLLAWHGWLLVVEAHARPLFPWDAWLVWSIKPKTWYLLNEWVPFVDFAPWLTASGAPLYTDVVPAYPEMLSRIEVWFASGAGCWCDPAYTLAWPALWLAMLVGGYGLLRSLGCGVLPAIVAIYALGSLPMLDTHVALPGYADLWLAVCFGFALLSWLHWQRSNRIGWLLIALLLGLSLPSIKVEGGVWMLLFLAIVAVGLLPARWRRGYLLLWLVVPALIIGGLVLAGVGIPLPGIGLVQLTSGTLALGDMSSLELGWHPVTGAVLQSLLVIPNWHLLFWLAPVLLAWRWRVLRDHTGTGLMALCLLGGVAFLFVLFFLTGAAAWASDFTSINRLVLQMTPALVFLLALLFAEPPVDHEAQSDHNL